MGRSEKCSTKTSIPQTALVEKPSRVPVGAKSRTDLAACPQGRRPGQKKRSAGRAERKNAPVSGAFFVAPLDYSSPCAFGMSPVGSRTAGVGLAPVCACPMVAVVAGALSAGLACTAAACCLAGSGSRPDDNRLRRLCGLAPRLRRQRARFRHRHAAACDLRHKAGRRGTLPTWAIGGSGPGGP